MPADLESDQCGKIRSTRYETCAPQGERSWLYAPAKGGAGTPTQDQQGASNIDWEDCACSYPVAVVGDTASCAQDQAMSDITSNLSTLKAAGKYYQRTMSYAKAISKE